MIRWAAWGEEAFARGRAERKPVLLSLTASWCHACHRMDDETWEDPGIAAAVERATVPVRVDADARPDIYERYHAGGLPTTAILTAEGDFVSGGTFLLPPQFLAFLERGLADFAAGRRPGRRATRPPVRPPRLVDAMVALLRRRADPEHGGFGAAPKLPEVDALTLLLREWRAGGDGALKGIVSASLEAIARHLYDARDGGFFRYAAGADWAGPHTEKVSVDQAQLARLFVEAGVALGEPRYALAGRHALAHARRRLADETGRVWASVAADPDYYEARRAERPGTMPAVDRRRFADAAAAMAAADRLVFATTGVEPGFQREFITAAPSGCVPHRLDAAEGPRGLLRDQALGIAAAVADYRLGGDRASLDWAKRAADWSLARLWDPAASAFSAAPESAGEGPRLAPMFPLTGNGEMALALTELAAHTAEPGYRAAAESAVTALSAEAARSPAGAALALAAQRLEREPAEADLAGEPGDSRARALARVTVAALGPTAVVRWTGGAAPGLTLCVRDLCLPSLADPQELLDSIVDVGLAPPGAIMT
ncbi:MAG TPA: DUF255 domain-containing protein [Methylomirabilota bacterium]|jgi:hypothetical protein|nr:DUF255 domain-containing protein [Methylomirabilota bacterium]